jgi:predicted DNA binding CopG/RHH family protein
MKRKITYTNEPLGDIEVIPDFLPPPAELAFREEGVKVTLALSKKSVEFFKSEASKHQTQYQRMIRRLLDAYLETQEERPITVAQDGRPASGPPVSSNVSRQREITCAPTSSSSISKASSLARLTSLPLTTLG